MKSKNRVVSDIQNGKILHWYNLYWNSKFHCNRNEKCHHIFCENWCVEKNLSGEAGIEYHIKKKHVMILVFKEMMTRYVTAITLGGLKHHRRLYLGLRYIYMCMWWFPVMIWNLK